MSQDQPARSSTSPTNGKELSVLIQDYLHEYKLGIKYEEQASVSPIQVDELASKVAKLYEKVRRIIDWKEENLVRRTAIERILKRSLLSEISGIGFSSGLDAEKLTEPLVLEMIRSGYFSNEKISKNKIPVAKKSLAKYIYILNNSPLSGKNVGLKIKEKINFYNWILEIAACELEEILEPAFKENALMNLMTTAIYKNLKIHPPEGINQEQQLLQTYIAVHRSLFNLDEAMICYNLLKYKYPRWFEDDLEFLQQFTASIGQVKQDLEADLNHPHSQKFFQVCEKYDAAYLILGDLMREIEAEPDQLESQLQDKHRLNELVEKVYSARLKTLKRRLFRSAIFSTLSIFVAGIASFIIFEGPVAKLVHGSFSWLALLVDLGVPSALMFILVSLIRPPEKDNLARVKLEVQKIVYEHLALDVYEINLQQKKNTILRAFFGLISLAAGLVSSIAIYWVFKIAGVPWTSIYVDTVNVAMVVFAAMLIRHKAKEITIKERGSVINMIVDLFSIPLAKIGKWFANVWQEYNIISVFFTALIDTPFSVLIGLIEDWRGFLKDERSDLH